MNFQSIEPIQKLWSGSLMTGIEKEENQTAPGAMFSDIFQSMIETVKETDAEKVEKEYLLATGQLDNPAELSIALRQYEASVTLLVQMRNKALDAYNELMRINV